MQFPTRARWPRSASLSHRDGPQACVAVDSFGYGTTSMLVAVTVPVSSSLLGADLRGLITVNVSFMMTKSVRKRLLVVEENQADEADAAAGPA